MAPLTRARSFFPIQGPDDPTSPVAGPSRAAPSSPLSLLSPGTRAHDTDRGSPPTPDPEEGRGHRRIPLAEAASATENVLGIVLRPPSDEQGESVSLFTPSRIRAVPRPLSAGSEDPSPVAHPKRRRRQDQSPSTAHAPPAPGLTLRIPGRPHIPGLLDRIAHAAATEEELTDNFARVLFEEASKGLDLSKPEVASGLKVVLTALAPDHDFAPLFPQLPLGTAHPHLTFTTPHPTPHLLHHPTFTLPYTLLSLPPHPYLTYYITPRKHGTTSPLVS